MNLDSLSFALSQINYLVSNLNKKNFKSTQSELLSLIENSGYDAERHLYRCLLSSIDFNSAAEGKSQSGKDIHQIQLLRECLISSLAKTNFASIFCFAIDNPLQFQESLKFPNNLVTQISKLLKLNILQEIALAILLQSCTKEEIKKSSQDILKQRLTELLDPNGETSKELANLGDLSIEIVQDILFEIDKFINDGSINVNGDQYSEFISKLVKENNLSEKIKSLLLLKTSNNKTVNGEKHRIDSSFVNNNLHFIKMDSNAIVNIIQELGYNFTSNEEECRKALYSINSSIVDSLIPSTVARVLSMMCRTTQLQQSTTFQPDTEEGKITSDNIWNVEVFVNTVHELQPQLQWRDVVRELDHPEFFIKDKTALKLLTQALRRAVQLRTGVETFPIEYLYLVWTNAEGQLSWIINCLKYPEIFYLGDYSSKRTATDFLKTQPVSDDESTTTTTTPPSSTTPPPTAVTPSTTNKQQISVWRCLNLIELLLNLSDHSNGGLYAQCADLFKLPLIHCPDLLILGLLQLPNIWNKLKQELLATLLPVFLSAHANSGCILQNAWNQQQQQTMLRGILMQAMTDWYHKAPDQEQSNRLARILDVSQDLKALSILLTGQPQLFMIDLACLASRRGYLKLDKWLSDRIRDHGELFITTACSFLRKKVPQLMQKGNINPIHPDSLPLLPETVQTILKCISVACATLTNAEQLQQEIFQMNLQAKILFDGISPSTTSTTGTSATTTSAVTPPVVKPSNPNTIEMIQSVISSLSLQQQQQTPTTTSSAPGAQTPAAVTKLLQQLQQQQQQQPNSNSTTDKINALQTLINNSNVNNKFSNAAALAALTRQQSGGGGGGNMEILEAAVAAAAANKDQQSSPVVSNSKDIEEDVDKCIQGLFKNNSPTVEEFVAIVAKLKDTENKREKDFYNYALRYIIDGNNCLYGLDDHQFQTMASVWGLLIDRGIFSPQLLNYCLKLLLNMLTKPLQSKYFIFAVKVLDRCKMRLKDYTTFCQYVMQLANFAELPRSIKEFIEFGARNIQQQQQMIPSPSSNLPTALINSKFQQQQQMQQQQQQTPSTRATMALGKPSIAQTTNIDTLLCAVDEQQSGVMKPEPPSEMVQDKIGFIFNNLSLSNLQIKSDELKDVLKSDDYWNWLAHYLVVKRVSIEPNFHTLYSQFMDSMKREALAEMILIETYRNIKVLLCSDKNEQKYCDRALLKNLGSWLGLITLAKNRPILQKDIDLKSLIIEAFQKGQAELLFVVPFVAKVLEPASKSKIFQPPNPWLFSMLSVLVELHNEPDLKLNHKFEIEVLCKNLSLNINDIPVKGVLRQFQVCEEQLTKAATTSSVPAQSKPVEVQQQQQPKAQMLQQQQQLPPVVQEQHKQMEAPVQAQQQQTPAAAVVPQQPKYKISDIKLQSIQNNASLVFISSDIPLFQVQPALKQFVIVALDKAITEMMHLLLEKAVKISVSTAEPLIKKDFALDPEESHMRIAARNMVANMSSGMMLITGKEPLTSHLYAQLKSYFTMPLDAQMQLAYKDMIAHACQCLVQDNIELCMCFLQKIAIQRSIMELERRLQQEFEQRLRARQEGRTHFDQQVQQYHAEKMPDAIRLKVGSVSPQQFAVYEEFGKNLPGFKTNIETMATTPTTTTTPTTAPATATVPPTAPTATTLTAGTPTTAAAVVAAAVSTFNQEEMNVHYENSINQLRAECAQLMASNQHFLASNLQSLLQAVHEFKVTQTPQSAYYLIKKLVYNLLEGYVTPSVNNTNTTTTSSGNTGSTDVTPLTPASPPPEYLLKYREANLSILKIILSDQRFCTGQWIVKEVQKIWLECPHDHKYTVEALACLFKYKLLHIATVDQHMAQLVDTGNVKALQYALAILRHFFIENPPAVASSAAAAAAAATTLLIANDQQQQTQQQAQQSQQFSQLLDSVQKIQAVSRYAQQSSELKEIVEVIRMNYSNDMIPETDNNNTTLLLLNQQQMRICATALSMMYTGVQQARELDDPIGLKEKSELLLHEWIQHHTQLPQQQPRENTKAFQQFVLQMNSQGLFKTDEMITRFFRICTEVCVNECYQTLAKQQQNGQTTTSRSQCYQKLDAFVKLIILLVKHSGDQTNHVNKINLFNKVLGLVAGCLLVDQEQRGVQFEPMPFHRLLFMLLFEALLPDNQLEAIVQHVLQAYVNVLHVLRPNKAPGFAYAWLELLAHRLFVAKMLQVQGGQQNSANPQMQEYKTWQMYATLLTQLIRFLAPFLRNIELTPAIMLLYKGTLRLFLVLLHDFPEFLCNCHYQFCDVIPSNCIQLRNLVLSAFPRCMKLPDPLTPNLKVDMIADIDSSPPRIAYPYVYNIPGKLKQDLDSYIKTRAPVTFLSELRSYLQASPDTGAHYNIQLMNALVIYVGTYGIQALRAKGLTPTHNNLTHAAHSPFADIFQSLVVDLDSEGRYLFINAVANQLRYPNSHTHYFGCALLNLFAEANSEAIQEQITRVLLERLIVNRPHPWGLLVTFIELIKNPQFKFWTHQFVHCAPEIEKMFQSLGRSCMKTSS